MSDKFENLKSLIEEYYALVKNHAIKGCLPPYATFKTYLVDEDSCCDNEHRCIDRPTKVKELVDKLDSDDKLDSILKLWSHGGNMYVSDGNNIIVEKNPKIIHSVSNTTRLQVFLKGGKKDDEKGVVINKENLLQFATEIGKYIKSFKEGGTLKDNPIIHNLVKHNDLMENNIDSVINEILFWYYYENDKYPIINSRAKNSRHILNRAFPNDKANDELEFNKKCIEIMKDKELPKVEGKVIRKQLMTDQLFYSIDEMKSMQKVENLYSKDNDIYKFYAKLWNTIKKAKVNKNLQKKYKEFVQAKSSQIWKKHLTEVSDNLHTLQKYLKENKTIDSYDKLNKIYRRIAKKKEDGDFLEDYIFAQENGIANAGQWGAIKSKADQEKINEQVKNPASLIEILKSNDINGADVQIEEFLSGLSKHYKLVKNRFLAVLFSEKMTTVAHEAKFHELVNNLKSKLNIKLESEGYIDQNDELMGVYLTDNNGQEATVYDKQIFYWWLYEKLKDNLDLKKAIVYYGAPGTGKTFKAKKIAKEFIDNWGIKNNVDNKDLKENIEVVQFHPSFSYEDFIEGIRPSKKSSLELRDGVFKKFCKQAGEIELALWDNQTFREKFKNRDFSAIKVTDLDGTVKSILSDKLSIDIDNVEKDLSLLDLIPPAFFIIDEINRADLSRVFGELMYSLEYRGYEGKIKTQYSYMIENNGDDAVYFWEDGNYFFIPQNLYIIGTMNTIDRSVDSFDFALRRRFSWEEIEPNYDVIKEELSGELAEDIAVAFKNLNDNIKEDQLLGNDYQIGHAYALNLKNKNIKNTKEAKAFLWKNFIYPLLQEYFRGLGDSTEKIQKYKEIFGLK